MIFAGDPDSPESDEDVGLLWEDAARLMDKADEVVFIGYSFPHYDQYSRKFFKDRVRGKKIVAVDPSDRTPKRNISGLSVRSIDY